MFFECLFLFLLPGSWRLLGVRQVGRAKGRLGEDGDDSLDNMGNDRHQMLYLVLIAIV